jgi:hypothetical protein
VTLPLTSAAVRVTVAWRPGVWAIIERHLNPDGKVT